LHGGWEYVWGRDLNRDKIPNGEQHWARFSLPGQPPGREGDSLLLIRTILPKQKEYRDPALLLEIALEDFEVFIDGKSIYKFGDPMGESRNIPSYIFPHIILLPLDYQGKELRILFHSSYYQFIGADRWIGITEESRAIESILIADYPRYLLGSIYFIIAIVSLIWFFVSSRNQIFLYYSLLVFFNAGITLTANYTSMFLFRDPSLPPLIYNLNLYLLPLAFYLFLGEMYRGSLDRYFLFGKIFYSLAAMIYLFLVYTGKSSFLNLETIFDLVLIPGFLFLLYVIASKAFYGDHESRVLLFGIGITVIFTFLDILHDLGILEHTFTFYYYGLFVFILFQGGILFRRLYFAQKNYEIKRNELHFARRIQNSILPVFPDHLGNWEMTSIYEPMKEIGGDFYDILMDEEGNIGIMILDVSGHGVGAALIASMAKVSFSHCQSILREPDIILREMDRSLSGKMSGNFATAFVLAISKNESTVRFSSAGHPSGLLVSHINNEVTEFRTKSKPIGINATHTYQKSYIYLNAGDLICLYTDGVTELMNPDFQAYGERRLSEILLKNCLLPISEVREILLQDFLAWTKHPTIGKEDDLTLILLRYSGSNI
jgi:serine phosphatase RsbU (regulator of sigma subunit)